MADQEHRVFRTSHENVSINETSSYVDLAPLYGHNQETQDKVRKRDGRGLLRPDTFAEDRLLLLPPAVCVLLVLFNRNHNVSSCFFEPRSTRIQRPKPLVSSILRRSSSKLMNVDRSKILTGCLWTTSGPRSLLLRKKNSSRLHV